MIRDIEKLFPDLTFFTVCSRWNKRLSHGYTTHVSKAFCTLESSLSLRTIEPFLSDKQTSISISFFDSQRHMFIEYPFRFVFAETGKIYGKEDIDEFKIDYFIVKLSGMKQ